MKISILTPTIRPEGLQLVGIGLERQTADNIEWIIGSPFDPKDVFYMGGLIGGVDIKWVKDDFTGGFWTLNRIYNRMIKESTGDIIVSIQDHTFFTPEAIEKFVYWIKTHRNYVISGVGDKYDKVYPELGNKVWIDPRKRSSGEIRAVPFDSIEGNFCAMGRRALYDVGGFDESLDFKGYGMDWYNVLDRIARQGGYEFYIDDTNESFSTAHGRVKDWEENNLLNRGYEVKPVNYLGEVNGIPHREYPYYQKVLTPNGHVEVE